MTPVAEQRDRLDRSASPIGRDSQPHHQLGPLSDRRLSLLALPCDVAHNSTAIIVDIHPHVIEQQVKSGTVHYIHVIVSAIQA